MDATRIRKPTNRSRTFRLARSRPIVIKINLKRGAYDMEGTDRLDFLRESLRQNPDDVFARYGLALELSQSEPAEA